MNYTPITPELLLELGFVEIERPEGIFFAKGTISLVYNSGWIPCKMLMGEPKMMEPYWNITTIDDVYRLEKEAGMEDKEIWDYLQKKQSESTINNNCPNKQITTI